MPCERRDLPIKPVIQGYIQDYIGPFQCDLGHVIDDNDNNSAIVIMSQVRLTLNIQAV